MSCNGLSSCRFSMELVSRAAGRYKCRGEIEVEREVERERERGVGRERED